MTVQNPNFPSFTSIVSILSILLYCGGFLRVELELREQKNRINHLENIVKSKPPSHDGSLVKPINNVPELKYKSSGYHKNRRHVSLPKNATEAENTADMMLKQTFIRGETATLPIKVFIRSSRSTRTKRRKRSPG